MQRQTIETTGDPTSPEASNLLGGKPTLSRAIVATVSSIRLLAPPYHKPRGLQGNIKPFSLPSWKRYVRFGSKAYMCGAKAHVRFTPPPIADMCSATRDVRFGPIADICTAAVHVCFTPESGHTDPEGRFFKSTEATPTH